MVDGAAVDSLVFQQIAREDPSLTNEVRVVQQSGPFGMPPMVVPVGLDAELADDLKIALAHMHEDEDGRKILKALLIDRFVEEDTSAYESVRHLIAEWEGRARK